MLAGQPCEKSWPYYDTVAGKTPLPKKTVANETNLANTTMNEQEKPSGRPTDYEEKTSRVKNAKEQDAVKKNGCRETQMAGKAKKLHSPRDIILKTKRKA